MSADNDGQNAFRKRLAEIRRGYLEKLREQGDELDGLVTRAASGEDVAEQILAFVHRLAGTAGSFGLAEISAKANALELALQDGADLGDRTGDVQELVQLMREQKAE